jgi:hypothetical protein
MNTPQDKGPSTADVIEAELRKHMLQPNDSTWHAETAQAVLDALTAAGYTLIRKVSEPDEVLPDYACHGTNPHVPHWHPVGKNDTERWCPGVADKPRTQEADDV